MAEPADLRIAVGWRLGRVPLTPRAVYAAGPVAIRLGRALVAASNLDGEPDRLQSLRAVAGEGSLVLLGDAGVLPWADGVIYLGAVGDVASDLAGSAFHNVPLLVPTTVALDAPAALVLGALIARHPGLRPPVAWPRPELVLSLAAAATCSRQALGNWVEAESRRQGSTSHGARPAPGPSHQVRP